MTVARALALVVATSAIVCSCSPVAAQSLTDIINENERLGPGCNPVALAYPIENVPLNPDTAWTDERSACITIDGSELRFVGLCGSVPNGGQLAVICIMTLQEGSANYAINCDNLTLATQDGPYHPDEQLSDQFATALAADANAKNNFWADSVASCTKLIPLRAPQNIVAVYSIDSELAETSVALLTSLAPNRTIAHITTSLPALQE